MRGAVAEVLRRAPAVAVAGAFRFLRHVQRLDQLARRQHVEGAVVERVGLHGVGLAARLAEGVDASEQRLAVAEFVPAGPRGSSSRPVRRRRPSPRRRRGRASPGPGVLYGLCCIVGDRSTNAGIDRVGLPLHPGDDAAEVRLVLALGRVHRGAGHALPRAVLVALPDERADHDELVRARARASAGVRRTECRARSWRSA